MNQGYIVSEPVNPIHFSKWHEPEYYPEVWAKCERCNKPYLKYHENQLRLRDYLYCSRACEAVQATPMYLIMSVPFDTKYLRRRG